MLSCLRDPVSTNPYRQCARRNPNDLPSAFTLSFSNKAFRTEPSCSVTSRTEFTRGRTSRSDLDSCFRTFEMSLGLKMRAAERGTVFRKKDRSSVRIARFTGGRNMVSRDSGFVASVDSIELREGDGPICDLSVRSTLEAHCGFDTDLWLIRHVTVDRQGCFYTSCVGPL